MKNSGIENRYQDTGSKRIVILGLDGTPYSFLKKIIDDGIMPNLKALVAGSGFRQMDSVIPAISCVAWSSFMTGLNPGRHGIFGFIERIPGTMEVYVPNATHQKGTTIWEYLSHLGKRVFIMNVPVTYPPATVNGILIGGFLSPDLIRGTFPAHIGQQLQEQDYRIDADTVHAREDLEGFMRELDFVFEKRLQTMWQFFHQEKWDFFLAHIMETDRLHHFLWEFMENGHPRWAPEFMNYYRRIDKLIGKIVDSLDNGTELMILSDHGFCTLKKEVFINKWLYDQKYLKFVNRHAPVNLSDIHPETKAYSLIPGRIYLNLAGREKSGSVKAGLEYESLRSELKSRLTEIRDPQTGEFITDQVLSREEIYTKSVADSSRMNPRNHLSFEDPFNLAPDMVIKNKDGFDFKGNLWRENFTEKSPVVGMHTADDAFMLVKSRQLRQKRFSIIDSFPTIMELMQIETPQNLDGCSVLLGKTS